MIRDFILLPALLNTVLLLPVALLAPRMPCVACTGGACLPRGRLFWRGLVLPGLLGSLLAFLVFPSAAVLSGIEWLRTLAFAGVFVSFFLAVRGKQLGAAGVAFSLLMTAGAYLLDSLVTAAVLFE
jgi:hypothetical protein